MSDKNKDKNLGNSSCSWDDFLVDSGDSEEIKQFVKLVPFIPLSIEFLNDGEPSSYVIKENGEPKTVKTVKFLVNHDGIPKKFEQSSQPLLKLLKKLFPLKSKVLTITKSGKEYDWKYSVQHGSTVLMS